MHLKNVVFGRTWTLISPLINYVIKSELKRIFNCKKKKFITINIPKYAFILNN